MTTENKPALQVQIQEKATYVLGIDWNRRGKDQTALVVIEQVPFAAENTGLFVKYIDTSNTLDMSEAIGRIMYLHSFFNFKKIICDETGLGSIVDILRSRIGHDIVEGITFTRQSKAEMFANLKILMQQGKLKIPDWQKYSDAHCKQLFYQFLSIEQEFTENSEIPKIRHHENEHDDIICALALACMYFKKEKRKRMYVIGSKDIN
jgi:phage FluMu gp28-like protein